MALDFSQILQVLKTRGHYFLIACTFLTYKYHYSIDKGKMAYQLYFWLMSIEERDQFWVDQE